METFTTDAALGMRAAVEAVLGVRAAATEATEGCDGAIAGRVAVGVDAAPTALPFAPTVLHAPPKAGPGAGAW